MLGARLTDGGQAPCRDDHGVVDSWALVEGGTHGCSRELGGSHKLGGSSELGSSCGLGDSRALLGSHALVQTRALVDH